MKNNEIVSAGALRKGADIKRLAMAERDRQKNEMRGIASGESLASAVIAVLAENKELLRALSER